MAIEDLGGQLSAKFRNGPLNRITGTNVGTFQKFSLPGVIVQELKKQFLTADQILNDDTVVGGPAYQDEGTRAFPRPTAPIYSFLDTQVYGYLEFIGGQYRDIDNITGFRDIQGIMIESVIFTVSRDKNIIETLTVGSQHSIKEYIAAGDYRITAECIIVGETVTAQGNDNTLGRDLETSNDTSPNKVQNRRAIGNKYPVRDMTALHEMLSVPDRIEVNSPVLNNIYGISHVVVTNYEFAQDPGGHNYQRLTIEMVSDEAPELLSKNDTQNEG